MKGRPLAKRADALAILAIALVALLIWFFQSREAGDYYEIYADGVLAMRVDPGPDREFSLPGHEQVVFSLKGNALAFHSSDCPDQICVKSGYLNRAGQTAACLPNRLTIRVVSKKKSSDAIDAVAG
ncbi:MAG: NusG domain II-containing protein [Clostridiales bacterium]|jgi:hypothetical protein|nr:NusG domain II-containing protein [Clostridiales bacterium]MDR2749620.1 NusG domain II-containing protein [Clostridiales bacterium]